MQNKNEYMCNSEAETLKLAKEFAKNLLGGDVVALCGDLGSGKTLFTKGIAEYFGVKDIVTSPTFVVLKNYQIKKNSSASILMHADCYRIKSSSDIESVGISDFLGKSDTICVIEWPERIKEIMPKNIYKINFNHVDEATRKIIMEKAAK